MITISFSEYKKEKHCTITQKLPDGSKRYYHQAVLGDWPNAKISLEKWANTFIKRRNLK